MDYITTYYITGITSPHITILPCYYITTDINHYHSITIYYITTDSAAILNQLPVTIT